MDWKLLATYQWLIKIKYFFIHFNLIDSFWLSVWGLSLNKSTLLMKLIILIIWFQVGLFLGFSMRGDEAKLVPLPSIYSPAWHVEKTVSIHVNCDSLQVVIVLLGFSQSKFRSFSLHQAKLDNLLGIYKLCWLTSPLEHHV